MDMSYLEGRFYKILIEKKRERFDSNDSNHFFLLLSYIVEFVCRLCARRLRVDHCKGFRAPTPKKGKEEEEYKASGAEGK